MKQSTRGVGGAWRIPSEKEVEVIEILLNLPKLISKSELLSQYSFTWVSKQESSPSPSPLNQPLVDEGLQEKVTAAEANKSPSTPLCFLPSVSKNLKRKATVDLMERYNGMQEEREILARELKAHHQELTAQNLELKAKRQEINYSRNIEDFQLWNNSMQQQQHCQQFVSDHNNGKLLELSCSGNSNSRFGLFNQIDPRVTKIHGETYDFMSLSQPLDRSKDFIIDNNLRARSAAAARKRRILRMKQNKYNSLLSIKLSRG